MFGKLKNLFSPGAKPAAAATPAASGSAGPEKPKTDSAPVGTPKNGLKILVVDDSPVVLRALEMKLNAAGFTVMLAADGAEAVGFARRESPNLILLDISLPTDVGGVAWDGFRIMEWLQRVPEAKGIPIIVISGGDPEKIRDRALAAGAVCFFHKPVDNEELLATIRHTLEKGSKAAPPG